MYYDKRRTNDATLPHQRTSTRSPPAPSNQSPPCGHSFARRRRRLRCSPFTTTTNRKRTGDTVLVSFGLAAVLVRDELDPAAVAVAVGDLSREACSQPPNARRLATRGSVVHGQWWCMRSKHFRSATVSNFLRVHTKQPNSEGPRAVSSSSNCCSVVCFRE